VVVILRSNKTNYARVIIIVIAIVNYLTIQKRESIEASKLVFF